jgi:formate dehydrogenase subunit beta
MARVATIEVMEGNPLAALQGFLAKLLGSGLIEALLVPQHLPMKNVVMPTLVTDPEKVMPIRWRRSFPSTRHA